MRLVFIGTSCMVPTKDRNVASIYLEYNGEGVLIDCGEGTQRQLNIAGINRNKVKKVLISHWHGDHVSGLVGLIQTIGNNESPPTLKIFGPNGTKERMKHLMNSCIFDSKVNVEIKELNPTKSEKFFENENYFLECMKLNHNVPCIGYNFVEKDKRRIKLDYIKKIGVPSGPILGKIQEGKQVIFKGEKIKANDATYLVKGKKITFVLDTMFCNNCVALAKNADVLISEAAYNSEKEDKAEEYKHMTAKQAADVAQEANVKKLIMTHFSQRYKTTEKLEEEAKLIFKDVVCAYDFMKINI